MFETWKYYINRKRLLGIGLVTAITVIIVVVIVLAVVTSSRGTSKDDTPDRLANFISNTNISDNAKLFSKDPHPAGGTKNLELASEIMNRWNSYGFSDVFENDYQVLLSLPTENSYIKYKGDIKYQPKSNDGTSVYPPFNAFSKNAKVSGTVVYVNYGTVEDFDQLLDLGVDLSDKIALCRYGKIFRGSKAQNAYDKKMIGMILYSDPSDSGSGKGDTYPNGPWLPDTGVQRGNVKTVKGDLSTHLYPSYVGGYHASESEMEEEKILPKIPVIPIPYVEAKPIHELIQSANPTVKIPDNWGQYQIGPSSEILELNVENNNTLSLCRNIIGVINGKEEPDRWVIVGFHRDAWINGAADPVSGMSTVMEITRSFSNLIKTGWQPRRTLIFASWDAEEPGIMGSYEFTEDYMTTLKHKAVAYINMDTVVSQPELLNMKSTPNLFELLYTSAKETKSPNPDYKTMYDFWIGTEKRLNDIDYSQINPPVSLIGSGSDFTAFLNEIGVSCIDFAYKTSYGTFPVYHTEYDTYQWLIKYGDPNFVYHQRIGQFAIRVIYALVNDRLLPMLPSTYATKVKYLALELVSKNSVSIENYNINTTDFINLSNQFTEVAGRLDKELKQLIRVSEIDPVILRNFNDKLMMLDRQFVSEAGLPGRPSFRHLLFAPSLSNTYAGSAFPGVVDEIKKQDEESTRKQLSLVATKLEAAIRTLYNTVSFL